MTTSLTSNVGPAEWLDRSKYRLSYGRFMYENFPGHEVGWFRCMYCGREFEAVTPKGVDVTKLQCVCGAMDSKRVRFVRRIYIQ